VELGLVSISNSVSNCDYHILVKYLKLEIRELSSRLFAPLLIWRRIKAYLPCLIYAVTVVLFGPSKIPHFCNLCTSGNK
jgi:hypothetical protein